MILISLRVLPRGPEGWASEELIFGKEITQLFGPNGCGKTPLLQALFHSLGYAVRFREDIAERCSATSVKVGMDNLEWTITRDISSDFYVRVERDELPTTTFNSERAFSEFLFEQLGLGSPALVSVSREATQPYSTTVFPLFYLDQDFGYTSPYHSPKTFIRDQYAEMMRLIFGLPPKNAFDQKRYLIAKKRRLEELDQLIVEKEARVVAMTAALAGGRRELPVVRAELSEQEAQLKSLRRRGGAKSEAILGYESLILDRSRSIRELKSIIDDRANRISSHQRATSELEIEINTLSLNDEARRVFASFSEICSQPGCGLFLQSSATYGKSLLYLRDQTKDLVKVENLHRAQLEQAETQYRLESDELQKLKEALDQALSVESDGGFADLLEALTERVLALRQEFIALKDLDLEETQYVAALTERDTVQDEIGASSRSGGADLALLSLRVSLRERVVHWLGVLRTVNVSTSVQIDSDFEFIFGREKLSQLKGSTLTRAILAIRAAVFELYCKRTDSCFRVLVLDTPRQQDIESSALSDFVKELKVVAFQSSAQVIFSTTEYHYEGGPSDVEWLPSFDGLEQRMFLNDPEVTSRQLSEGGTWERVSPIAGNALVQSDPFGAESPGDELLKSALLVIRKVWQGRLVHRDGVWFGVPNSLFKVSPIAGSSSFVFVVRGTPEMFGDLADKLGLELEREHFSRAQISDKSRLVNVGEAVAFADFTFA